ncbi:MAG TPA: hypothetical protein VGK94_07795 [Candidatus Polarisedimenticolia bacterium]|jgi:hypothetical protein
MSTHRARRLAIHPAVDLSTLRTRHARLLAEYDRLAGRLMVSQAEVRRLGRTGARHMDRIIAAEKRAAISESALTASQGRPAACVRLLLRCERLLYRLSYPRCASCKIPAPPHRRNCRIQSMLTAIQQLVPI